MCHDPQIFLEVELYTGLDFFPEKTIFSFPVEKTGNIRKKLEEMEISGKNYA